MEESSALVDTCQSDGALANAGVLVAADAAAVAAGATVGGVGALGVATRVGGFGAGASSHPIKLAAAARRSVGARRTRTIGAVHFIAIP